MSGLGAFQGKEKKRIEVEVAELSRKIELKTEQAKKEKAEYNDSIKDRVNQLKLDLSSRKEDNKADAKRLKEVTDKLLYGGK